MGNEKRMAKESNCRATEERLLKEIENLKDGMISFWTCSSNPNSSDEERIDHINIKLDQHRETKKAVYEDVKEMINNLLAKGLNGKRYNFMINGEELKDIILGDSE